MSKEDQYAGRYFVMRKGYGPTPPPDEVDLLSGCVYFNHWSRRLNPFQHIQEGDTLYLLDHDRRTLAVELRVNYLVKSSYEKITEGMDQLRAVYGLAEPDEGWSGYTPRPGPGFMLAYGLDVIGPIDIPFGFPWDVLGGRHGYISVDAFASSEKIDATDRDEVLRQLPEPGRNPIARAETCDTHAVANDITLSRAPRRPSLAVMKRVRDESGGECQATGCKRKAEHFDHIVPWSRGGNSEYENMMHLCATCNLTKSDTMPNEFDPNQLWFRIEGEVEPGSSATFDQQSDAVEVHTENSVYFAVFDDDDAMLAWKRGSRSIWFTRGNLKSAMEPLTDGTIRMTVPGFITTSPVTSSMEIPAERALGIIGYADGIEFSSPLDQEASV